MSDQTADKVDEHKQNDNGRDEPDGETVVSNDEASATQASEAADSPLQQELDEARRKAEENWELALRTKAELENLHKRVQRDVENAHKYGLEKMAGELLSVRDSMELGLNAAEDSADEDSLKEGMNLTLKMLTQVMEKFDINEINPLHEKFNPDLHQAMNMQESEQFEPNTVISVMQKGYVLNDRLLRPALVTVAKAPDKSGNGDRA